MPLIPPNKTIREVAEIFRKTEKTIRRWCQEGAMFPNARKIKDGWLIPLPDVERHFDAIEPEPPRKKKPVAPLPPKPSPWVTGR